ncbi:HesA/MoeB/ThiF family protein [Kushneria marisflavi]|uniref:Molybdopterin-synthase adenylyltransferase MoeB n=1 Tax=Kushneria marisflavi TaxID=157779 RepID=A0A240UT43_9GAMM|nr:molybdopterin-synthase adenylyltransferase MoeB [Kushneria marisflavi]ART64212.1 molybdopterin-synthase adenylyltransferase MoeB [Kushneria marisflavi]RKD76669.1 adenylyltransferase/sulfurtransferase [Kushneria marisflavi]
MNDEQLMRYSRQIMLSELDYDGQVRLTESHALIIGLGGLGSPAALYLAAAGVGTLTLADDDRVDLSNLQRQIAHGEADIDHYKAQSAAESIGAINHHCRTQVITERLQGEALQHAVEHADVVLDCTDRFESRDAINRACVAAGTPLVSGAAIRFSGQLAVFDVRDSAAPCYACLYGDSGDEDQLTCAESGVIAPLVGMIGSYQALEALKLLSGCGTSQKGLSTFDGLSGQWRHFGLGRDPHCPVCQWRR